MYAPHNRTTPDGMVLIISFFIYVGVFVLRTNALYKSKPLFVFLSLLATVCDSLSMTLDYRTVANLLGRSCDAPYPLSGLSYRNQQTRKHTGRGLGVRGDSAFLTNPLFLGINTEHVNLLPDRIPEYQLCVLKPGSTLTTL